MNGLVQSSLQLIYETYLQYRQKIDIIYVAFSGGKDSLVLLDLVQGRCRTVNLKLSLAIHLWKFPLHIKRSSERKTLVGP